MPTLDEALRFATDVRTPETKLRDACAILGIPDTGDGAEVRGRLVEHLRALDSERPVVCLNPAAAAARRAAGAAEGTLRDPGERE